MEEIIGYTYKLYYESTLLYESEDIFDTEDEATEEANTIIDDKIRDWDSDGAWHPEKGDDRCLFDIVIDYVTEDEI